MKAMQLIERGAALVLQDVPMPEPGPGEVRVRITACGLNFGDTLVIKGTYQEKPDLPATVGMEIAGVIDAVGPNCALQPGTRIASYCGFGGLAEYAVLPEALCVAVPDQMADVDAAAFLVAYGTSHVALDYRAHLQAGETLLVLGAAGGVGLTAVELGKLMGAKVIACARGADKLRIAEEAGADHLIDSDTDDLKTAVKALGGADVVYDPVGGALFDASLRACNLGARVLPLGFASGTVPQIAANYILVKNISVLGFYWGGYVRLDPSVLTNSFEALFDWYLQGKLRPHVSHTLPLTEANEGLDLLRNRTATGKVVIRIPE